MATYLIAKEITITRKAGDVADIVITVPVALSMSGRTARFGVFRQDESQVMLKEAVDCVVSGQTITIALAPEDTEGKQGDHVWELEVINDDGPITIGKGDFKIQRAWLLPSS